MGVGDEWVAGTSRCLGRVVVGDEFVLGTSQCWGQLSCFKDKCVLVTRVLKDIWV